LLPKKVGHMTSCKQSHTRQGLLIITWRLGRFWAFDGWLILEQRSIFEEPIQLGTKNQLESFRSKKIVSNINRKNTTFVGKRNNVENTLWEKAQLEELRFSQVTYSEYRNTIACWNGTSASVETKYPMQMCHEDTH
jgi:hypothetical protein